MLELAKDPGVAIYFSGSTKCFDFTPEVDDPDPDDEGDEGGDIALLQVPLWVENPELSDTDPADEEDDENTESPGS